MKLSHANSATTRRTGTASRYTTIGWSQWRRSQAAPLNRAKNSKVHRTKSRPEAGSPESPSSDDATRKARLDRAGKGLAFEPGDHGKAAPREEAR